MNPRLPGVALLVLAGLLAACGSSNPTPVPATASAAPSSPASPSGAAASSGTVPSVPGPSSSGATGGGDLRSFLPTLVGGHTLAVTQFGGSDFATGGASQEMVDLLKSLGRTVTDMTLAMATDPTRATDLNVTAFRVRDVPVDTFVAAYLPMLQAYYQTATTTPATRAGRAVTVVVPKPGTPAQVLLTSHDILFVITSADAALVDEAISKLP